MSWIEGNQKRTPIVNTLEEAKKLEGFLDDKTAKVTLTEFLRNDPTFASNILLGVKLFPFQHMLIKGMFNTDYFMGILSRASSKCLKHNGLVQSDKGLKRIIDIEVGDKILSKNGYNLVEDKVVNPKEKTYGVRTKGGYECEGLDYHRVQILNPETLEAEWKFVKDIKVGEVLVMKKGGYEFPSIGWDFRDENEKDIHFNAKQFYPKNASLEDWYYFFGLLLGDGCMSENLVSITNQEPEIIVFLEEFFNKLSLHYNKIDKGNNTYEIRATSKIFVQFLEKIGFRIVKANEKSLPLPLTNASKECLTAFIRGLYDTDGYCSLGSRNRGTEKRFNGTIGFTSTSEELIELVKNLLLMFGIKSRTYISFKGGKSKFGNDKVYDCLPAKTISITGYSDVIKFNEQIGFATQRKIERLNKFVTRERKDYFCDYVPYVGPYLKKKYKKSAFSKFAFGHSEHYKLTFRKFHPQRGLRNLLEQSKKWSFVDTEDFEKISQLAREDFFFEEVKETFESEDITVDIQVADEHCYVSDGIINHNSFSTAIFAALYAIFEQGVKIGIISASFRQSKTIIKKLEDIMLTKEATLFHQAVNTKGVNKGTDQWSIDIGKSSIMAIPLGDGQKLRGFRFNVVIIDEFLLMPERIYNEVIKPFLAANADPTKIASIKALEDELVATGKMKEEERTKFSSNKIILLSSAGFKFEYIYKVYCEYEKLIMAEKQKYEDGDDATRAIFHTSYKIIPTGIYDEKLIKESQETMSEAQFAREFGSVFTDDSAGYFKMSKMIQCTFEEGDGYCVEIVGDPKAKYLVSIDPSWSESESSDNFSIQVFRLLEEEKKGVLVHAYAIPGTPLHKHILYFKYVLEHFNVVMVVGDYNGGLQFIKACNQSQEFKDAKIDIGLLEFDAEDQTKYNDELYKLRNEYNLEEKKICHLRKQSTQWIRQANEMLQSAFDHKGIYFAAAAIDEDFRTMSKMRIPELKNLKFSRNIESPSIVDFIERQKEVIEMTKTECTMINPRQSASGTQTFDLPENLRKSRSPNKARKDSYSTLVLGNWGIHLYFDMMNRKKEKTSSTFSPFLI
jgi:hypothetical protein